MASEDRAASLAPSADLALLRGGLGTQSQAVRGRVQHAGGALSLLIVMSAIVTLYICTLSRKSATRGGLKEVAPMTTRTGLRMMLCDVLNKH